MHSGTDPQPDISIFEQTISSCDNKDDYQKCPSIPRLSTALQYYQHLDITNNEDHQNIFKHFMTDVYPNYLNDHIHFVSTHAHQIEDIHNDFINNRGFKKCTITNCVFTSRHHRLQNDENRHEDPNFFKQSMDSLHHYIFHIFDSGLRITTRTIESMEASSNQDNEQMENEYFDARLAQLRQSLTSTDETTESFERFGGSNNSKFIIKTQFDSDITDEDEQMIDADNDESVETYLDSVYNYFQRNKIDEDIIQKLCVYLRNNGYDTDSFITDMSITNGGNVAKYLNNPKHSKIMTDFIQSTESMISFSKLRISLFLTM